MTGEPGNRRTLEQDSYMENLEFMSRSERYNAYLVDSVRSYLGTRVLDVGCGLGNTTRLLNRPLVVGMDVSENYVQEFKRRLPDLEIIRDDISDLGDPERLRSYRFDTIFCSNVLEHIRDDRKALSNMWSILAEGGTLILQVPNHPFLFGAMDEKDLHFRRYDRRSLREKVIEAGFRVEELLCVNFPGIFWWYITGKLFKRAVGGESEAGLINWVIPAVRLIDKLLLNSAGLTLVVVARK
jgi:SAM-dependent methyltransferase